MLRIHIGSIAEKGLHLNEQVAAARLPLLNTVSREDAWRFDQPIHVRIQATLSGETVLINGTVATRAHTRCSRCLDPFDLTVESAFTATAVPQLPAPTATETTEEIELVADDMEVIVYSGDSVDLSPEIAQQIVMALPFNPLCKKACKGLCSRCGANLNQASCRCAVEDTGNPFAALRGLSLPRKKE